MSGTAPLRGPPDTVKEVGGKLAGVIDIGDEASGGESNPCIDEGLRRGAFSVAPRFLSPRGGVDAVGRAACRGTVVPAASLQLTAARGCRSCDRRGVLIARAAAGAAARHHRHATPEAACPLLAAPVPTGRRLHSVAPVPTGFCTGRLARAPVHSGRRD